MFGGFIFCQEFGVCRRMRQLLNYLKFEVWFYCTWNYQPPRRVLTQKRVADTKTDTKYLQHEQARSSTLVAIKHAYLKRWQHVLFDQSLTKIVFLRLHSELGGLKAQTLGERGLDDGSCRCQGPDCINVRVALTARKLIFLDVKKHQLQNWLCSWIRFLNKPKKETAELTGDANSKWK